MSDQPENTPGAKFPEPTLGAGSEAPPPDPTSIEDPKTRGQADIPTDVPDIPKGDNGEDSKE